MGDKQLRYVAITILIALVMVGGCGLLNYLVDPLWFFGGNKLEDRNFPFDERVARIARFVASDRDYDCYIFGGSRLGLVNENSFAGHRCYMVTFANATPSELIAYASYIKARAKRDPSLVIVGIDDYQFIDQADEVNLPAAVRNNESLYFWQFYFSFDVMKWSVETILDRAPLSRYFGKDLTGKIRADAKTKPLFHLKLKPGQQWHFSFRNIAEYRKFRAIFPHAHFIACATPIAADRIMDFQKMGLLPVYLKGLHDASAFFDETYDFSIPSALTANPDLTYDGSHFYPPVTDRIATALQKHDPDFGIAISGKTLDQITELYAQRLKLYVVDRSRSAGHVSFGMDHE